MRIRAARGTLAGWLTLTRRVALLSLVPIVALGFVLARVLQSQVQTRALADATQSARLVATLGILPKLTPETLRNGLSAATIAELDRQLHVPAVRRDLARIKIWNSRDVIVYSDENKLIDRTPPPSDDLADALRGHPHEAAVIDPRRHTETYSEVGLGALVEVYVPLRFTAGSGPPAGAFEIYLSYAPIAAAVSRDKRTIALLVGIGLALLWASLFRIVAGASRRLRRQARENDRLARYDQLTGLPNRTMFIERVGSELARRRTRAGTLAVLLIDLDRFKQTNNTLGNANGDRILIEVAARLGAGIGEGALVARLGADEYAVLCAPVDGERGARDAASAIHTALERPIEIEGVSLNVEASIGIAVLDDEAADPDELLQRADTALARARSCRSRVEVYSQARDSVDAEQLMLLGEVRGALERDEFVLHFQPKVDLRTRRIAGVEALLRWQHPYRGLLSPMEFVPAVEQTSLVGPVTLRVIELALEEMRSLKRLGVSIGMAVNISARDLHDGGLAVRVGELLRQYGVAPQELTLEVTESAAMTDPARAITVLEGLRATGVKVALDDFGTGNASIEYLATLPADELKIDQTFVTGILEDPRAEAIVHSTIELARHLGLRVVAEGIETSAVMERVAELGCDVAQGYFIAHPLPAEELHARLSDEFAVGAAQLRGAPQARARAADAAPGAR